MGRAISNDFSWSKSRHERYRECRRAYYYHYYQSWGGWESAAAKAVRELYVLKKLGNRFTWGGSVVHSAIRGALMSLRHQRPLEPERAVERAHAVMREDFGYSKSKAYWTRRHVRKDFSGLVEHEYDEPVDDAAWKANWENVRQGIGWFFQSRWPEVARGLSASQWIEIDVMDFDASHFQLRGTRVFAAPDFAYREADGAAVIVDWKTGKAREGYDDQVLGYALYLQARYQLPLERMRAVLVYVNDGVEQDVPIDPEAVRAFEAKFEESVAGMRALLADAAANVPLPESAFPKTEDLSACARCPFRRPCGREAAAKAAAP